MSTCQKTTQDSSVPPAVAAATPHTPGTPTPRADAAGARGNLFRFPVTLTGYVEIDGDIADEARNTVGIDIRNALADPDAKDIDLDNGGKLTLEGFEIDGVPIDVTAPVEPVTFAPDEIDTEATAAWARRMRVAEHSEAMVEALRRVAGIMAMADPDSGSFADSPADTVQALLVDCADVPAILAAIDGEG